MSSVEIPPTWQEWRQMQAELVPQSMDRMLEMVAETKRHQERFAALFRRPDEPAR